MGREEGVWGVVGARQVVLGGDNVFPLVEIGLTDLPKTRGAKAPPAPLLPTALIQLAYISVHVFAFMICKFTDYQFSNLAIYITTI